MSLHPTSAHQHPPPRQEDSHPSQPWRRLSSSCSNTHTPTGSCRQQQPKYITARVGGLRPTTHHSLVEPSATRSGRGHRLRWLLSNGREAEGPGRPAKAEAAPRSAPGRLGQVLQVGVVPLQLLVLLKSGGGATMPAVFQPLLPHFFSCSARPSPAQGWAQRQLREGSPGAGGVGAKGPGRRLQQGSGSDSASCSPRGKQALLF